MACASGIERTTTDEWSTRGALWTAGGFPYTPLSDGSRDYRGGELRADGFLVMQDSRMRRAHTPSLTTSYVRLRARLKQENIVFDRSGSLLFRENYLFASPSAAASVLLGRNANGLIEWKDAHGVSLRDQVRAVNDG